MKRETIEEIEDVGIEEIDLSEGAMYKRAFKKFYFKQKTKQLNEDDDYDCADIEEDEDIEVEIDEEDTEIEEEDI